MAKYEVREGQCNLFRNDYKKENKQPDYKNQVLVDGKLKDVALWVNQKEDGSTYFGLKITDPKPQEGKQQYAKPVVSDRPLADTLDDGIPF